MDPRFIMGEGGGGLGKRALLICKPWKEDDIYGSPLTIIIGK